MKIPGTKSAQVTAGVNWLIHIYPLAVGISLESPYGMSLHLGPFFLAVAWLSREDIKVQEQNQEQLDAMLKAWMESGAPPDTDHPDHAGCSACPSPHGTIGG